MKPLRATRAQQRVAARGLLERFRRHHPGDQGIGMAYLDLEEQEQLAELKAWWKENGNLVRRGGRRGGDRRRRRGRLAQLAGATRPRRPRALRRAASRPLQANDAKALRDAGGTLIESFPRTLYATMGALAAARFHFDRGDLKSGERAAAVGGRALAVGRSCSDIARLRLAERAARREGLRRGARSCSRRSTRAALRGAVRGAAGRRAGRQGTQPAEAQGRLPRSRWRRRGERSGAFRDSVQLRLDALGG